MGRRYFILVPTLLALAVLACSVDFSSDEETAAVDIQTVPLVLLLAPVNGSIYAEGTQVELAAIAQDSLVSRLEFRVDDAPVGDVAAANPNGQPSLEARLTWTAEGKQGHLITVEGFRADGSSLGIDEVAVTVTDKPVAQALTTITPTLAAAPDTGSAATEPAATNAASPTSSPADMGILTGPLARVNSDNLYVRQGPGTNYPQVGALAQGDRVPIVGHNAEFTWWAVSYGGGTGWVFASLIIVEGDSSQVPLGGCARPLKLIA